MKFPRCKVPRGGPNNRLIQHNKKVEADLLQWLFFSITVTPSHKHLSLWNISNKNLKLPMPHRTICQIKVSGVPSYLPMTPASIPWYVRYTSERKNNYVWVTLNILILEEVKYKVVILNPSNPMCPITSVLNTLTIYEQK